MSDEHEGCIRIRGGKIAFKSVFVNRSGASAIEFAIVGPIFVLILMGMISYGGYFWLAHMVQQLTNDAARSAVAGLSASERTQLAQGTVNSELQNYAFLEPSHAAVTVDNETQFVTVTLAYDASNTPFWGLDKLVPMPSTTISRAATIKLGGY
jgi:Flp pilus assembly protein TadG